MSMSRQINGKYAPSCPRSSTAMVPTLTEPEHRSSVRELPTCSHSLAISRSCSRAASEEVEHVEHRPCSLPKQDASQSPQTHHRYWLKPRHTQLTSTFRWKPTLRWSFGGMMASCDWAVALLLSRLAYTSRTLHVDVYKPTSCRVFHA